MKRGRWIMPVWIGLMSVTFVGWTLFTYLRPEPDQPDKGQEPGDAKAEPEVYGVVKSVDRDRGTITLGPDHDGREEDQTYQLANDATVLLKDGPAALDKLPINTRVALEFGSGRKAVIGIRSEPFRIVVAPKQEEVEVDKLFDVELRVVNASMTDRTFHVMFTTWVAQWRSNNRDVSWDKSWYYSYRNGQITITLAPGQAYTKTLPMRALATGRVAFKMGFTPLDGKQLFTSGKRTYWSPEATLTVSKGPEKN